MISIHLSTNILKMTTKLITLYKIINYQIFVNRKITSFNVFIQFKL